MDICICSLEVNQYNYHHCNMVMMHIHLYRFHIDDLRIQQGRSYTIELLHIEIFLGIDGKRIEKIKLPLKANQILTDVFTIALCVPLVRIIHRVGSYFQCKPQVCSLHVLLNQDCQFSYWLGIHYM